MGWEAAAIIGGTQLLGGMMQGDAAGDAARTQANAQLQAGQMAADAQKFRPVGITSRFGSSNFSLDGNGYLSSAGYTPSAELLGYQNFLSGQAPQTMKDVSGLLNLGRGYIGEDPQAVRQRYIDQQRALLAPENEQALAGIRNKLFQTGRAGLATGATTAGDMAATNPEMAAYYNALAKQNAALTAGADQAAQQQVTYGQGLLSSAYSPLQTNVGLQSTFEQLAQSPLDIGAQLGGRAATAGANVGQSLLAAGNNAANSMFKANSYSPWGSAISGVASNPLVQQAASNYFYQQPVQPGQYTPGSSTFMGPMPGSVNTGVSQWYDGSQGF